MMEMVMEAVDGDGDRMVSLDELLFMLKISEGDIDSKEMFKRMIRAADKDRNGFLSAAELKGFMLEMKMKDEDDEDIDEHVNMFFMMADTDGDKKLKIEEVISFFTGEKKFDTEKLKKKDPKEEMKTMFRMCDCNGDGFISKKEIVQFLKTMGLVDEEDTPAEVKMVINMTMSMADEDKDGKLNYEEFCKMMDKKIRKFSINSISVDFLYRHKNNKACPNKNP